MSVYANTAYMKNASKSNLPLYINCCGNEKDFSSNTAIERPSGRSDYLLLYVPTGSIHLFIEDKEYVCPEKTVVLYRPYEPQRYGFFEKDKPETFWVHFSGHATENILKKFSLESQNMISLSATDGLEALFSQMISECQSSKPYAQESASLILQSIFILIARNASEAQPSQKKSSNSIKSDAQHEITKAISCFNEQYTQKIDIDEYAQRLHMSTCWFIKTFKKYTYTTPKQYILTLRIAKAKELLESSTLSISEIASAVGFADARYFSRIFKQQSGVSPLTYRQNNW